MASVPLSASSSQAGLLLLPLSLLQPVAAAGACLRYRLPRLPPGLSSVRKGRLLSLPAPLRAAEGRNGWALTKEEVVDEEVRKEGEEEREGDGVEARGSGRFSADYVSLGIREPEYEVSHEQAKPQVPSEIILYRRYPLNTQQSTSLIINPSFRNSNLAQVIEVRSNGRMSTKKISRRQLLKSSGTYVFCFLNHCTKCNIFSIPVGTRFQKKYAVE